MTKHLRLIMLSLLAMICMGGYSAVGDTYKLVTSVSELNAGDVIAIASKESGNALGLTVSSDRCANVAVKIINNAFEYVEGVAELSLEKEGTNWYFATADKKYLSTTAKRKLKYFEKKDSKSATIEFEKTGNALINFPAVDQTNIIRNNGTNGFAFYAPSTGAPVQIYKKQGSGKTATTLSFKDLVGEGVTLINGKLANGDDFNGYTATEKDNVAGTIAYAASGDGVATVDEKTGAVTVYPNVFGTTTITATFTPTETEKYAGSTASYTITNIKSKYYATVADLRKDLNNGTLNANDEVAVKLTDAKVLYVNEWTAKGNEHTQYFVREGNAAISFYDTDIKMSKSAVVNGTFMGKIGSLTGLLVLTKNNNTNPADLQVKASTNPAEPIEISTDDIANYVCDLVTVKGATVIGGTDCALFNGNNLMPLYYNKFFPRTTSLEAPYDNANVDLTSAIVLTYVNDKKELVYELAPTDKYTLVYNLSEESVNTIAAKTDIAVSLKRTFYKDGEWNTLCLPFAVANAATAFDGAELREVDVTQSSENTIVFKEATTIEAGKPYLIKWAKTPNEVCDFVNTFEGVTLVATATPVKVNDAITFTGFYNKATADKLGASVAAIGPGNKLFKVTSGEMKGFRAAFVLNPATPAAGINVVIDGTTTGIEDLVVDGVKANGRVYNLNGQYVGNSLNGLQPGIYIQNGKKVVVK